MTEIEGIFSCVFSGLSEVQPIANKLIMADISKRRLFLDNFMIINAVRECLQSFWVKNKFSIFFD